MFKTLGLSVKIQQWGNYSSLPFFLQNRYDIYITRILNHDLLMLKPGQDESITPAGVKKDFETLRKIFNGELVFVTDSITSYDRKRLIDHKVPFIVPNNQLYLPELGIDLREHFKKIRSGKKFFSPSTQVIVLYAIANKNAGPFTPAKLAETLGYSSMTMTRAFDEIKGAGIGTVRTDGRERKLKFNENIEMLWQESLPYMRTPVRKTVWGRGLRNTINNKLLEAGLTALSQSSMLAATSYLTKAIDAVEWKRLIQNKNVEILPFKDGDALEIQIWSYAPQCLTSEKRVDPFSLYLSLYQEEDERIQKALHEMMERIKW